MKIPIVKEWGSWVVFIASCTAGLITGLLTHPWQTGRDFSVKTLVTILGLTFFINSKNPLASALRTKGSRNEHLLWLLIFGSIGFVFLIPFLLEGIMTFSVFSLLILSYLVLLSIGKEHHLFAELNGFALLTLSAPIVYFVVTGEMSLKLYAAVFLFFGAGVLKVRVRLKKTLAYRWVMILYCAVSFIFFYYLDIPVVLLLPLIENIITALWMREERLRTTGNIELIKSVIFIVIIGMFWS
jgi:hypothetical protein